VLSGDLVPFLQPLPNVKAKPAMLAALGCRFSLEPDMVLGYLRRWAQAAPAPGKKEQQEEDDADGYKLASDAEAVPSSSSPPTFTASVEQVGDANPACLWVHMAVCC
jgi:hypothetical protein